MKIYQKSLFLLFVSVIVGGAVYIAIPQLQFFRVMLILFLFITFLELSKNSFKLDFNSKLLLIWFSIYYFWTIYLSLPIKIDFNSYINFNIIYILVIVLILNMNYNTKKFLDTLYKALYFMFYVMLGVAIWEIVTHHHLKVATFFDHAPEYIQFQPSTFYTNPNDFMAMLTLLIIFLFGYKKILKYKIGVYDYIMLLVTFVLSFITNSRIVMMVLALTFLIISFKKKNIKYLFFIVVLLIGLFVYIMGLDNNDINYLLAGLSFGGDSTSIREHLYIDALLSIQHNFGMGYGINNSYLYYQQLNDPNLEGIINPHNYLLEILINSGVYVTFLYLLLNLYFIYLFIKNNQFFLVYMIIIYEIVLISSSSSIFLWFQYVYYISILGLYSISTKKVIYAKGS